MLRRPLILTLSCTLVFALFPVAARSASVIKGQTWFPIGPAPISGSVYGDVVSGRAAVLAVNPQNSNEVFLGAATGGVWHTLDGGVSWTPIGDNMPSMSIGAITLDPSHCTAQGCTRIYVGTGENSLRRDTYYGRGLMIGTASAGAGTWVWDTKGESQFSLASINDVILDPTTSGSTKRLYVAVSSGVTASATESTITGPAPGMGFGIYRSDSDGSSWSYLTIPNTGGAKPTDLEMDPKDSNLLFAGFLGKGIFKGVRNPITDSITWCPLNPGTGGAVCPGATGLPDAGSSPFDFVEITINHSGGGSAVLYGVFGNCIDPISVACSPPIYESADGGTTWTLKNAGAPMAYSRYTHVLTTFPTDPSKLLYGGTGLFLSYDSASDFNSDGNPGDDDITAKAGGNQLHPDTHDIVFANPGAACTMQACNLGGNNCVIYVANDGGFYRSTNSGCTFSARNDGLQITGFQSISASPDTPVVIGGTQDNGTSLFSGSSTWTYKTGSDSCSTAIDLDTPTKTYDVTTAGYTLERLVQRSTSGGSNLTWPTSYTIPSNEQASFYPPMVQDPTAPHALYLGTDRLYQSTTDASSFSAVSPVLGGNQFYADIQRTNVITAIGVAPSNHNRIYVGYYDGQIWVTKNTWPCNNKSCWDSVGGSGKGLPQTVVTWIAVDPSSPDTAYAAFSGFFSGPHLFKTVNGGGNWTAANGSGGTMLPDVPVNTVAVEPSTPQNVWVGTDSAPSPYLTSVYKSTDGGNSWAKFGNGLPNVPIFALQILERPLPGNKVLGQVYAATHGRGAFILTQPDITNFEGWVNGSIWDVPVYGDGYPKNQSCTVWILQSNGTVCAQGMIDARGGTIGTDSNGKLTSSGPNYQGQDVVWACFNGLCVNNVPIADCNDDETGDGIPDLLSTVLVECGGVLGIDKVLGCPQLNNPPGSILGLDQILGGPSAAAATAAVLDKRFSVLPSVQARDGSTRVLCEVPVSYSSGESKQDTLLRARDQINADATCQGSGVAGQVAGLPPAVGVEEDPFQQTVLSVDAPAVAGGQIMIGLRGLPGEFTGTCFDLEGLGATALKQILVSRVKFSTPPGGALGGTIRLVEQSPLGACDLTLSTVPGSVPSSIIQGFNAMFQAPGIPGPFPACPSSRNPRDATMQGGDSLLFVLATGLTLCVDDPGVGVLVLPEEICMTDSDCDDDNGCTQDVCDTTSHRCMHLPDPDGTPCQSADRCTTGTICRNGVCGVPLDCNDFNPCTIDWCDPLSGGCVHQTVVCNDGNACTSDYCNPDTGQCATRPLSGAICDDGDPCTTGDHCVSDPLGLSATCQGTPQSCNDGNPCTLDVCDPNTGQCVSSPLVCDDGNICTRDSCDPRVGGCVFTPLVGQLCNDGDPCTQNDVCRQIVGGPVFCSGTPASCDDGNLCTTDSCDSATGQCLNLPLSCDDGIACTADACLPSTGACTHQPIAPREVPGLGLGDSQTIQWPATPDAAIWNTYRGTIPAKLLGSRLPGGVYDHVCFESDDAHGDGATTAIDNAAPPLGTAYYYDVTGENPCGEGPLGAASSGIPRPNPLPCPTPP